MISKQRLSIEYASLNLFFTYFPVDAVNINNKSSKQTQYEATFTHTIVPVARKHSSNINPLLFIKSSYLLSKNSALQKQK